jgi:hypothetical protein
MNTQNNIKKAAALLLPAMMTSLASGAVIYSENADGLTAGVSTLSDSTNWTGPAGDYGVVAAGAIFTTNHFELTTPDSNFNFANRDEGSRAVMTLSLDLVDLGTSTSADAGLRLAFRQTGGSTFLDVTAATIADNTIVHYDYVFNNTGSAVTFEDGVTTIAANTAELWAEGVMVASKSTANATDAFGVGLWNRRPDNAFLADNIEIRDTAYFAPAAVVPEPSSLGLAAFGLLGLARRRRA